MKRINKDRGIIIISILMVTIILLLVTTSILFMHSTTLGFINLLEKQTKARKLAEAGVAYALYSLRDDANWGDPKSTTSFISHDLPGGKFNITFVRTDDYFSVNNIMSGADPNGGYKEEAIPGYSVVLFVEGIADPYKNPVKKRYRVILQTDSFYDGALASGSVQVGAGSIDISNESEDPNVVSSAGSLHSNSVKGMIDPDDPNGPPIGGAGVYAIGPDPDCPNTVFNLHGGIASAQGDIHPAIQIDTNSSLDPGSKGRHIKPVDIKGIINDAFVSSTPIKVSGSVFVIGKDSFLDADGNSIPTAPFSCTIDNGRLDIESDIIFTGDTRFEFDYDSITRDSEGNMLEGDELKAAILNAGVQMESNSKIYVKDGNFTVAGPIKGNGACYVGGNASYVGQTNLVGSEDPGVAVLANENLNLELPEVSSPLSVDITGLVYANGNVNVGILDLTDDANPANNFRGGKWPPDWEEQVYGEREGVVYYAVDTTHPSDTKKLITMVFTGEAAIYLNDSDSATIRPNGDKVYIKVVGVDPASATPPSDYINLNTFDPDTFFAEPNTIYTNKGNESTDMIFYIESSSPCNFSYYSAKILDFIKGSHNNSDPNDPNANGWKPCKDSGDDVSSGEKVPPNFKITGALVSIDPNNPTPDALHPDDPNAGNINIDIHGGNINIICSSRYLKLLRVIKEGTVFRIVSWSEI